MSEPWDSPPDADRWGDEANTTADAPAKLRITAVRAIDAMAEPAPAEIVEGVAWDGCVTVLVAESGAGKTFLALDLAAAVSAGFSWHGRAVTQGTVVHIGYEGDAIGLRLRALHEHRQARLEHVYRLRAFDPISPLITRDGETPSGGESDVRLALRALSADLEAEGHPPVVLLIVDTVRASMHGSEDASDSVSAYLRAVRRLITAVPGAGVILVHHAGWQDGEQQKKRERGSSAFRGNVDATLYLEVGEYDHQTESAPLTLTTHKVRDGEKPAPLHMVRQRVTFTDTDAHGKPLTSCVIDPDSKSATDRATEARAKLEDAEAAQDLRTLKAIHAHPEATSQDRLRLILRGRKEDVNASVARLLGKKWIAMPEKQRQPYTVTPAGRQAMTMEGS